LPERGLPVKDTLLKILTHPLPLRPILARKIIEKIPLFSYKDRLVAGAVDRPHYGYCIFHAAKLAARLNYPRISVIEFGCGGGNGLLNAEMHIVEVMKIFPVEIDLYGFDMGSGLPDPVDYRDMPYYFESGFYKMERRHLEQKIKRAKLVIGDVKNTCATFFDTQDPAPVGCMFHDLDFYSSTSAALALLDADVAHFLPRIFMYFDDIVGNNEMWCCNDFTGERLAIEEFNRDHQTQKISKDYYSPNKYPNQWWPTHIYIHHNFRHPRYNDFVARAEQRLHEDGIELKSR
jgi:hypothetical protein